MTVVGESTAERRMPNSSTPTAPRRAIGALGTVARLVVGALLLVSVVHGHATAGWHLDSWLLAVAVFPCVVVSLHALVARRHPARVVASGPLGHLVNAGVFLALWLTPEYAPALEATSDAALIFYGASMLLAALCGTSGCEVTVLSNLVLHRDDEVGCALFLPFDAAERRTC